MSVLRSGMRSFPSPDIVLRDEDTLILGGDPDALERAIATDKLVLEGQHRDQPEGSDDSDIGVIEAVVNTNSILVGQTAGRLRLQRRPEERRVGNAWVRTCRTGRVQND